MPTEEPPGAHQQPAGYQLGTPEYAACRRAAAIRSLANVDAAMAEHQRQNELIMQQMNRRQTCTYSSNTAGGVTNDTVKCMSRHEAGRPDIIRFSGSCVLRLAPHPGSRRFLGLLLALHAGIFP